MGVEYVLVNESKKEIILFMHLGASKKREIVGNPASSAVTSWYLITNRADNIRFYSDEEYQQLVKDNPDVNSIRR